MTRLAGKYELIRLLGRGGMAEVWEAVAHGESGFRRRVAVKRIAPERAADAQLAGLFVDEARVSSALHHPNVVSVVDFGLDDGVAFQVMELVDGVDAGRLASQAAGPGLPVPLALGIAARVGRALHAAHTATDERGAPLQVVHRDVSPQNVLLSRRGEVKLSDFGIARWQHRTEPTLAGVARGKPSYMAPEQATKGDLDGRADVFSLGCTLHVLITRTSPLGDENALVDLLAGVPLELSPALPPAVGALVARAVQRDRNARFSTALAFAEACEAVVEALAPGYPFEATLSAMVAACAPPPAAPPIAGPPRVPAMRRRVWPLAVVAAALAAGLVGLALSLSRPPQVQAPADDLVFAPLDADRTAVVTRPVAVAPEVSPAPAPMPVTPKPPAPAAPQPPRAPPRTGVIAVGGERFLRAEVFVDGRSVGFAPQQLEVSVGLHPVELVLPGGERVGPRVLAVGAQHTEVSPLRWVE